MTWINVAVIGSAIVSAGATLWAGNEQAKASEKAGEQVADATKAASQTQADAADRVVQLERERFEQQRRDNDPFLQAGKGAIGQLNNLAPFQFGMDQFQADPGYTFRMNEGMRALEHSAAARGKWLGSSHLKSLQGYGQEMASQEYQNAFNRASQMYEGRANHLRSLAGVGQTAVSQIGQAGQNFANNAGNLMVGGANALAQGQMGAANALAQGQMGAASARSSGYLGAANTLNSALGSYLGYNQSKDLLNRLAPKGPKYQGPYAPPYYGG